LRKPTWQLYSRTFRFVFFNHNWQLYSEVSKSVCSILEQTCTCDKIQRLVKSRKNRSQTRVIVLQIVKSVIMMEPRFSQPTHQSLAPIFTFIKVNTYYCKINFEKKQYKIKSRLFHSSSWCYRIQLSMTRAEDNNLLYNCPMQF